MLAQNCRATVEFHRTQHYGGSTLTQYDYVQKKHAKKTRAQVLWFTTGLIVLFVGSLVVVQIGETDVQRKSRILEDEKFYVGIACKLGERACGLAKEDSRKVTCKLFQIDCSPTK